MRVSSEGSWDLRVATGRVRVSGWDLRRIFDIMRVKVKRESSSTCERRARGDESVLKSACESARQSASSESDWEGACVCVCVRERLGIVLKSAWKIVFEICA